MSEGVFIARNGGHTFVSNLDGGPGNSGSPIFNDVGRIIGILSTSVGSRARTFTNYGDFFPQHVFAKSICHRLNINTRYPGVSGCR